jgi:hypothetical protein
MNGLIYNTSKNTPGKRTGCVSGQLPWSRPSGKATCDWCVELSRLTPINKIISERGKKREKEGRKREQRGENREEVVEREKDHTVPAHRKPHLGAKAVRTGVLGCREIVQLGNSGDSVV